jgi:hypothetical protein
LVEADEAVVLLQAIDNEVLFDDADEVPVEAGIDE